LHYFNQPTHIFALAVITGLALVHYAATVVFEVCNELEISAFRVKKNISITDIEV
jgi:hypothetical protein